jgi:hypothetical protein
VCVCICVCVCIHVFVLGMRVGAVAACEFVSAVLLYAILFRGGAAGMRSSGVLSCVFIGACLGGVGGEGGRVQVLVCVCVCQYSSTVPSNAIF